MERRKFRREFKFEAKNLVREWGVSYDQTARDLDVIVNILRRSAKEFSSDPKHTYPNNMGAILIGIYTQRY